VVVIAGFGRGLAVLRAQDPPSVLQEASLAGGGRGEDQRSSGGTSGEIEAPVPFEVAVAGHRAAAVTEAKLMSSCSRLRRSPSLPLRREW
jgi:hypothetical protein